MPTVPFLFSIHMPLSRLPPRSRQKGLTPRSKASGRTATNASGSRSRHLSLWEAIRLTREEIDNWHALSKYIDTLFRQLIVPREQRITNVLGRLTGSLINHLDNPTRDAAERSLLGLWIIQNLDTLNNHPFATNSDCHDLLTRLSAILDHNDPIESQLIRLLQPHRIEILGKAGDLDGEDSGAARETFSQRKTNDLEEESEQPAFDFGWHKKASPTNDNRQDNSHGSTKPAATNEHNDKFENDPDFINPAQLDAKIRKSQKSLSVNRLFRQLAKVLHPDREQDEAIKAEKHLLMSQCLEARQRKDIDTLLQLYCEHVGDLPEDLTDKSHKELISALELQLKLVQRELRQQRFGDALLTQIVERYSDSNNHRMEAKVALHAKQLDQEIRHNETVIERLNTQAGLQLVLNQRRSIESDRMTIVEITGGY
ncbi:MAG: hypothetical protein ACI9UN_000049 [Granulosicoccus sp.]|jgi:hypothetical protein